MGITLQANHNNCERLALLSGAATTGAAPQWVRTAASTTDDCLYHKAEPGDGDDHFYTGSQQDDEMIKSHEEGKSWASRKFNIRTIGVVLFVLASCYCVHKILGHSGAGGHKRAAYYYTTELKLANVFSRHGDRSPSEDLPPGDKHVQRIDFFWPNGMANLTDGGKMRQYRLGYALRRRYSALMADSLTASSQLLAFSSAVQRCVDSARLTLRGFYSLDRSRAAGLRWLQDYNANCFSSGGAGQQLQQHCSGRQLAAGSGSPAEWEKVNIDLHGVPSLDWHYLDDCYWRRTAGRSDIDSDLMLSAAVANLTGILQLKEQLERSYNLTFVYDTINHWSTILTELRLEHTKETVAYTDHFAHWINKKVTLENGSSLLKAHQHRWTKVEEKLPTLFDVYEVLNLYVSRDRIPEGTASRIQLGPMLVSLIDSQQVALAGADRRAQPQLALVNKEYADTYKDRRVLLYFTHDTIIQLLMFRLHLIEEDKRATYAERFVREYEHDMARQFLAGLRMAEFGTSLAFELYEIKRHPRPPPTQAHSGTQTPAANSTAGDPVKSYAFVQAALYYEEEPTLAPVEFKYLKLGSACRHLFKLKFPSVSKDQMEDLFYDKEFTQLAEFSRKLSCPFELFRNVTMQDYAILPSELDALCLPK